MAAASLLGRQLRGKAVADLESLAPELARYAGFSASPAAQGTIDDYARASFAFDVLLAQDRGVDEKGMVVPQTPVAWERAFDAHTLVRLQAPFVRLDVEGDRIEVDGFAIDPVSEQLVRQASKPGRDDGVRAQSTDYGPAIWNPAHSSNYNASRSAAVSAVTLHTAQGSYAGTEAIWIIWPTIEAVLWAAFLLGYLSLSLHLPVQLSSLLTLPGIISYSVYLIHFILVDLCLRQGWLLTPVADPAWNGYITTLLVIVPLTVLAATLSYWCIERPLLALRRPYRRTWRAG